MARAALNWSVKRLATAAGVHRNTVMNLETERSAGDGETLAKLQCTLQRAGVEFTNGDAPGVRLRRQGPPDEGLRPHQLTAENHG
jgi:transcriptional regulator with XRE-family HTH domain